jgi:hypothetical protein
MVPANGSVVECCPRETLVCRVDVRPSDSSSWATACCPRKAVTWSAVRESTSFALTSAPALRRACAIAGCRAHAALWRAVSEFCCVCVCIGSWTASRKAAKGHRAHPAASSIRRVCTCSGEAPNVLSARTGSARHHFISAQREQKKFMNRCDYPQNQYIFVESLR